MSSRLHKQITPESGASTVEYVLLLASVVLIAFGSISTLGEHVNEMLAGGGTVTSMDTYEAALPGDPLPPSPTQ